MRPKIDLTGRTFGRWSVVEQTGKSRHGQSLWRCKCECGNEAESVLYGSLIRGASQSCGCLHIEQVRERFTAHGRSKSQAYHIWQGMKTRCYNQDRTEYPNYGGRGITVCQRWLASFENFLSDMGEPPWGQTLDRFPDPNGNYEPGNCRWATRQEQARNKRNNVWREWKGEQRTLTDIARLEKVAYHSFRNLVTAGKSPEDAIAHCRARKLIYRERMQAVPL